jgi:hypothetical protein
VSPQRSHASSPTDDPGARSDDDGSLTTRQGAFLSGALLDCEGCHAQPRAASGSLGLGILSAFNQSTLEAMDSRARPSRTSGVELG